MYARYMEIFSEIRSITEPKNGAAREKWSRIALKSVREMAAKGANALEANDSEDYLDYTDTVTSIAREQIHELDATEKVSVTNIWLVRSSRKKPKSGSDLLQY
ncbi:unnamed protein product [Strongylus vulgaris]|uniref:Uncharacterized protein n=1 Tax=Strongylus vulgaris TaxID=40348 RepID=A0A3P7LGD4_STRVU|nr:unnamed protein product [Strongylus vulgaris]